MQNFLKTWLITGKGKKILLLRHGHVKVEENNEKRFIGQLDLPLSEMGRRQAHCWRQWLSDAPIERIISSNLSRCTETAHIIAADRSMEVTSLAGLREINLGQWDGMLFSQVKERWPEAFRQRGMEVARFRPPAGESFLDLQQRVVPVFEKEVDHAGGNILMVAHAGVNRMILCHLLGMPPEHLFRLVQDWGSMNLIDRQANEYRIHCLNLRPAWSGVIQPDDDRRPCLPDSNYPSTI